jgi:hypothetical protein
VKRAENEFKAGDKGRAAARPCRSGAVTLFLIALSLLGCRREDIRVYDAPKENAPASTTAQSPTPSVSLPEGWEQAPGDQMSLAKFVVHGKGGAQANISVTALPPSDEAANVNRWRRQLALEPATPEDISKQREAAKIGGHDASLFDIAGSDPATQKKTRIVGAMASLSDAMWFFKMMGDDELVASQKSAFTKFIATFPLPGHEHPIEQTAAPAIAPSKTEPPKLESPATASERWKAPASWKEEPAGPMQEAKFSAANGKATVTISIFPGETGGLRPNVDRWRRQIGLGPVTDEEFPKVQTPLELPGAKATIVDMTGSEQRLVAAVVTRADGSTWFIKLLGDKAGVASERAAFIDFVKTTK